MNFDQAKQAANIARAASNVASDALQAFPKGPMGLTPDHVKASPEWKAAYALYNILFAKERAANAYLVKHYKKELTAERNAERNAKYAAYDQQAPTK